MLKKGDLPPLVQTVINNLSKLKMTQVDEWSPMVVEKLTATLGDDAPKLITLMKDVGAILSGGFVLNSIVRYEPATTGEGSPDLDIYVPVGNMPRFLGSLVSNTIKFKS
jgi:hypothetical protein